MQSYRKKKSVPLIPCIEGQSPTHYDPRASFYICVLTWTAIYCDNWCCSHLWPLGGLFVDHFNLTNYMHCLFIYIVPHALVQTGKKKTNIYADDTHPDSGRVTQQPRSERWLTFTVKSQPGHPQHLDVQAEGQMEQRRRRNCTTTDTNETTPTSQSSWKKSTAFFCVLSLPFLPM